MAVLMVIYLASFTIGVSNFLGQRSFKAIVANFGEVPYFTTFCYYISVKNYFYRFILVFTFRFKCFFNQSLLVLFLELSKPIEAPTIKRH